LGFLITLHLLSLVGFFLSVSKSHLRTFWWTKSGREFNTKAYWTDKPDNKKWGAIAVHKAYQPPVEEMVEWVRNGWKGWEEKRPKWFVENKDQLLVSRFQA